MTGQRQSINWTVDMLTGLFLLVTETDLAGATLDHTAQEGYELIAEIFSAVFSRPATADRLAIGPWDGKQLSDKYSGRWHHRKPIIWRSHVMRTLGYFSHHGMEHRSSLRLHLLATAAALGINVGPHPVMGGHPLTCDDRLGGNVVAHFKGNAQGPPANVAQQWNGGAGFHGPGAAMIPALLGPARPPPPFVAREMPAEQQAQPPLPGQVAPAPVAPPPFVPPPVVPPPVVPPPVVPPPVVPPPVVPPPAIPPPVVPPSAAPPAVPPVLPPIIPPQQQLGQGDDEEEEDEDGEEEGEIWENSDWDSEQDAEGSSDSESGDDS